MITSYYQCNLLSRLGIKFLRGLINPNRGNRSLGNKIATPVNSTCKNQVNNQKNVNGGGHAGAGIGFLDHYALDLLSTLLILLLGLPASISGSDPLDQVELTVNIDWSLP